MTEVNPLNGSADNGAGTDLEAPVPAPSAPQFPKYAPEEKQKFTQMAETARQSTQRPGASEVDGGADGAQQPSELQVVNEETRKALETAASLLRNPSSVVEGLGDIDGVAGIATARQENDKSQPTEAAKKGLAGLKRAQEALQEAMEDQATKLQETTAEFSPDGVTKRTDVAEIAPGTTPEVAEGAREVLARYYEETMQNAQEAADRVADLQRQIAERATEMSTTIEDKVNALKIASNGVTINLDSLVSDIQNAMNNEALCATDDGNGGGNGRGNSGEDRSCATFEAIAREATLVIQAFENYRQATGVSEEDLQEAEHAVQEAQQALQEGRNIALAEQAEVLKELFRVASGDRGFREKLQRKIQTLGVVGLTQNEVENFARDPDNTGQALAASLIKKRGAYTKLLRLATDHFAEEKNPVNPTAWRGYNKRRARVIEALYRQQEIIDRHNKLVATAKEAKDTLAKRQEQLSIDVLVGQYEEELGNLFAGLKDAVKDMLAHTAAANALSLAMHTGVVTTAVEETMAAASDTPSGESFDPTKPVVDESTPLPREAELAAANEALKQKYQEREAALAAEKVALEEKMRKAAADLRIKGKGYTKTAIADRLEADATQPVAGGTN